MHDFIRYVMQQWRPYLMARFQTNCIFKIYGGVIQNKNTNIDKRHINKSLTKKVIDKFR